MIYEFGVVSLLFSYWQGRVDANPEFSTLIAKNIHPSVSAQRKAKWGPFVGGQVTDTEKYVAESISAWVWSGFYGRDSMRDMMEDVLEEDCDVSLLEKFLDAELARKIDAEAAWPSETDCDRLDRVFFHLHEEGICALANAGYTMSDGYSEVSEAVAGAPAGHYHGYCFYHGQDVERAVQGHGVMVAFGDLNDDSERGCAIGRRVCAALANAGFEVSWDGTEATRIDIPSFDWKRRHSSASSCDV